MPIPAWLAVVGAVGSAKLAYDYFHTPDHQELLEDTYKAVDNAVDDAEVRADHGVGDGNGELALDGIEGRPDLVVRGFGVSNLLVEVETADALDERPQHIIEQVDGFQKEGYRRVLVVPDGSTDQAAELCKQIDGKVTVSTPSGITKLL